MPHCVDPIFRKIAYGRVVYDTYTVESNRKSYMLARILKLKKLQLNQLVTDLRLQACHVYAQQMLISQKRCKIEHSHCRTPVRGDNGLPNCSNSNKLFIAVWT